MNVEHYLQAMVEQLRVAAPQALAILREQAPRDATILMAAVEAASLLREAAWLETADRALVYQVLEATRSSAAMAWLVGDALDLGGCASPPDDEPALEGWLDQLVALASIAPYLPDGARQRVDVVLDEARAVGFTDPERVAALSDGAAFMSDALDLSDEHPVAALLRDLAAARDLVAVPVPTQVLQARLARTAQALRRDGLRVSVACLAASFGDAARWLQAQLDQPGLALAADGDVLPPSRRFLLGRVRGGEFCLVLHGGRLLVEWAADDTPAPQEIATSAGPLVSARPLVEGCPCWDLALDQADTPLVRLELTFADGTVEFEGAST